jgi:hypothetical protein
MSRALLAAVLLLTMLVPQVPAVAWAQGGPDNRTPTVTITANGAYQEIAGSVLVEAFDQARASSFRRRLLELRLLMDQDAFAYDPEPLGTFRELVDDAYERVGGYQDIPVVQQLLQVSLRPDLVNLRRLRMNVALSALRTPTVREAMKAFLGAPTGAIYSLDGKDVPRIWQVAAQTPNSGLDAVGNMAMLGASALAGIQASNPYAVDVFDPVQEAHFHDVRKTLRSTLLLLQMYPETRETIQPTAEPLFALISQYGDVNDAFVAYRLAPKIGANTEAAATFLRAEFVKAQKRQQAVQDARSFDALIAALSAVQQRHQR